MGQFITKQGEQAVLSFKYKGGSVSYSYQYLWAPLADFCLNFIPKSMAPNLITLTGFLIFIAGCLNVMIQTPLSQKVSPTSILILGICTFVYQTLDNIDGKQARRTGTSSPLGMLFDHGLDALCSIFLSFTAGRMMLIDVQQFYLLGAYVALLLGFFFSVWAQYHSGGIMMLGRVNAVDDGIPTFWVACFVTYIFGQQIWLSNTWFGIKANQFAIIFTIIAQIIQMFSLFKNSRHEFTDDYLHALSHVIHYFLMMGSQIVAVLFTDWGQQAKYFYQLYFSLTIVFIRNITYMQLCVVTKQPYTSCQAPIVIFILSYPIYVGLKNLGQVIIDEFWFVNGLFAYFILDYLHLAVSIVYQMSSILKIKVFSIPSPKEVSEKTK